MKKVLIALAGLIIAIQFIPVERTNPPVTQNIDVPENVSTIIRTSCYDCHSNETNWPWYSYVAPVSFFISGDVKEGRKHLNFSEWDKYDEKKKEKKLGGIVDELEDGEMPLKSYQFIHSDTKIDKEKLAVIKAWAEDKSGSGEVEKVKLRYKDED